MMSYYIITWVLTVSLIAGTMVLASETVTKDGREYIGMPYLIIIWVLTTILWGFETLLVWIATLL